MRLRRSRRAEERRSRGLERKRWFSLPWLDEMIKGVDVVGVEEVEGRAEEEKKGRANKGRNLKAPVSSRAELSV